MVWRLSSVCSYRATRNQLIEFPIVENPEFWKLFNFNCETSARLGGQGQTLTAGAQSNLKYQKCWEDYRRVGGCGQGYITVPVCVSKIRCRTDWVIRGRHCCTISNLWRTELEIHLQTWDCEGRAGSLASSPDTTHGQTPATPGKRLNFVNLWNPISFKLWSF